MYKNPYSLINTLKDRVDTLKNVVENNHYGFLKKLQKQFDLKNSPTKKSPEKKSPTTDSTLRKSSKKNSPTKMSPSKKSPKIKKDTTEIPDIIGF